MLEPRTQDVLEVYAAGLSRLAAQVLIFAVVSSGVPAFAQSSSLLAPLPVSEREPAAGSEVSRQTTPPSAESIYDKVWKFAEWYEDESNPAVQKVLFTGRFQY
jgi:hypothetical protein